jgi:hypothetical protein
MSQDFVQTWSNERAFRKKQVDERLGILGEFFVECRLFREDTGFGDLVVVLIERELPCQQGV